MPGISKAEDAASHRQTDEVHLDMQKILLPDVSLIQNIRTNAFVARQRAYPRCAYLGLLQAKRGVASLGYAMGQRVTEKSVDKSVLGLRDDCNPSLVAAHGQDAAQPAY